MRSPLRASRPPPLYVGGEGAPASRIVQQPENVIIPVAPLPDMLVVAKLETLNVFSFLYRMARAVVNSSRVTSPKRVECRQGESVDTNRSVEPSASIVRRFPGEPRLELERN